MPDATRSLADSLRRFGDARLEALLLARPDLAAPVPRGVGPLAARAAGVGSARRALGALTRPELQLVEALAVLPDGASPGDLAASVGADPARIATALERIETLALVWGADALHLVRPLREGLRAPAGLAAPDPGDPDDAAAREIAASARDRLGDTADALAAGPALLTGTGQLAQLIGDLGLVRPGPEGSLLLRRSVQLALRGGRVHTSFAAQPPTLTGAPLSERIPGARTAQAVETAFEAVRILDIIRSFDDDPPSVLRRGGLPGRDLRRLATRAGTTVPVLATILQAAWQAGLIGHDGQSWRPTQDWDEMRGQSPQQRWAELVLAWVHGHRIAAAAGSPGETGQPRALLSEALRRDGVRARRHRLLQILHEAPSLGVAPESLRERLAWYFPLVPAAVIAEETAALLAEGGAFGLIADGALTTLGLELVGAADEQITRADARLVEALTAHAPAPVREVLVDADGTLVIPGRPAEELRSLLDWAEPVSRGAGLTLRLTSASVRSALGAGRDPGALLALLEQACPTPLPQAVTYLIEDETRRHARIEVARASTVLTADAEVLDRLLTSSDAAALRLRRVAPTVVITDADAGFALQTARRCGLSPVAVGPDGTPGEELTHALLGGPVDTDLITADTPDLRIPAAEAVERIRAADAGEEEMSLTDQLLAAIARAQPVQLGIVDGRGGIEVRTAVPLALEGGRLRARDEKADGTASEEFTVLVHRVTLG